MKLSPMRYKSYTWPHNPKVYSIDFQRAVAMHKTPFGRCQLQDLGLGHRVMEGEGEFTGEGAYAEFQKLACVFYEGGPGLLTHPLWQAASAYFVALRVEQAPRPDYVKYSFVFWEENAQYSSLAVRAVGDAGTGETEARHGSSQSSKQAVWHRVVRGDTLWALARQYGLTLEELIALNPQIKNPNLIRVGEEVRVE